MIPSSTFVPYSTPTEDNYSSEEELKEIINEQKSPTSKSHPAKKGSGLKRKSQSKKEKSPNLNSVSGSQPPSKQETALPAALNTLAPPLAAASVAAEKRKWSEVISDDDLADLDEDGLELEMTSNSSRNSR